MTHGAAVDQNSTNKNKRRVQSFPRPNNPKKTFHIHVNYAYTYITIPVDEFLTREDESEWCASAVTNVLKGIISTMKKDEFKATLERFGRRRSYVAKLYDSSKKTCLSNFLDKAVVKAAPVDFLTNHVIQSVSNDIMTHLYDNRQATKKYSVQAASRDGNELDQENSAVERES